MHPMSDFEHQLSLSSFSLASHSLRLLGQAGLIDDDARRIIRSHLQLLEEKLDAIPDPEFRNLLLHYLDTLTRVLPPSAS